MKQSIAHNLRQTRTRAGRTQEQIACESNIDRRRLSDLERGVNKPNPQEREQLIAAGHLDPAARNEERAARSYQSKWKQKPLTMYRKSEHTVEQRLKAALKTFGRPAQQRLDRLENDPARDANMHFLSNATVDSGLEMYVWLSLLTGGARALWISPARAGFRRWPVIRPHNFDVVSDARFPAVEFEIGGAPAIAFPQLTVAVRNSVYRLDAVLGLRLGKKRIWLDLEIDGAGHDGAFDAEREERLDLPTIRIHTDELRLNDIYVLLERKLRNLNLLPETA